MAASGPADPESNIFCQFDVQQNGELVAGCTPVAGQFWCLLSPCYENEVAFKSRYALEIHRERFHGLPGKGTTKLPTGRDISDWMRIGKPRPYDVPGTLAGKKASLRDTFFHCSQPGMAELQPASLGSNIFEQFDVRKKEGFPNPVYVCLLAPCFENEVCFKTHAIWERHRSKEHMEPNKLPTQWQIRDWVAKNKPRPYDVPVTAKPEKKPKSGPKPSLIDPGVFTELDIRVTDEGKERIFCLLYPCSQDGTSFVNRRCWRLHRMEKHNHADYKNGVFTLPPGEMLKAWVEKGKPIPFQIPPTSVADSSGARPPREMRDVVEERRLDSPEMAESNVFLEIDYSRDVDGNLRFFCLLPNCVNSRTGFARRQALETHRSKVHADLPQLEHLPTLDIMNRWIWLGKPRPYTPPDEEPSKRIRIRTRDAAGGSSEAEPAHQKKPCQSSCSVAASNRNGSFWRYFLSQMKSPDDLKNSNSEGKTASSQNSDSYDDD